MDNFDKPINLTSFNPLKSGNRDSLALFFEEKDNRKTIRVHRQYYRAEELKNLVLSQDYDAESLDIVETVTDLSLDGFRQSLADLRKRKGKTLAKIHPKIEDAFRNVFDNNGFLDGVYPIDLIDELNDTFFYCRYSLGERDFVLDELAPTFDGTINSVPFTEDQLPNFIPGQEPSIEGISPLDARNYELRVYNVGQASCSALIRYTNEERTDYKVVVVFDLGYQKRNGKNEHLNEMINRIDKDTTIVISHFHNDHFNNATKHVRLKTCRWLFPSCEPKKHRANVFFRALLGIIQGKTQDGTIYLFNTPYDFSENLRIHQRIGPAKDPYQKGDQVNAESLVCELLMPGKRILIPGDALYEEWDSDDRFSPPYDYILIPHHGCLYANPSSIGENAMIHRFIGQETTGICSCGANKYGHANENHLAWYGRYHLFAGSKIYDDDKNELQRIGCPRFDYYSITFE